MEENKKPIKIKLTTIIFGIIILAVIVAGIIFMIINEQKSDSDILQAKTNQTQENPDIKIDNKDQDFAFKFLKIENDKKNMIYSPLSINYALHMLNEGANGNTKAQIENVIGNANVEKYDNIKDILSLANALYIRENYGEYVKNEYKNKLYNLYNAEIKYDSFYNANIINGWIENKTFGQIKNMLRDEVVNDPSCKMILINALAIDMEWKVRFKEENTHGMSFYLDNGEEVKATMMNMETSSNNVAYYKDNEITAISMDLEQYNDQQMEFVAIMPSENLSEYVSKFEMKNIDEITNKLKPASKAKNGIDIYIPKFSFDYELKLKSDLKKLGITDVFKSGLADFSNMSKESIYVSDALHKANIDFTEKGVKAAAVTVIIMRKDAMIMQEQAQPLEIKIDKPFMYLIRDKKNGEIWFVGTVYQPNLWKNDYTNYQNH